MMDDKAVTVRMTLEEVTEYCALVEWANDGNSPETWPQSVPDAVLPLLGVIWAEACARRAANPGAGDDSRNPFEVEKNRRAAFRRGDGFVKGTR